MSTNPNPATWLTSPVARNQFGIRTGSNYPVARLPDSPPIPSPMSLNPDVLRGRCWNHDLFPHGGWLYIRVIGGSCGCTATGGGGGGAGRGTMVQPPRYNQRMSESPANAKRRARKWRKGWKKVLIQLGTWTKDYLGQKRLISPHAVTMRE